MSRRIAVWMAPEQIPLIHQVAEALSLSVVAAGSPLRGQSSAVAGAFGALAIDDLRAMLLSVEADLILIATAGSFASGPRGDDVEAVLAAGQRGIRVATLDPVPASALDLASARWGIPVGAGRPAIEVIRPIPLMRMGRTLRNAADVLESFGHFRLLSIECWSRASEASLGAQIYSAMDALLWLMGEPETIDAAYVSPIQGTGVHMLPGETLRDLHGDLSATMRFADGRTASLVLSDQGGRWNRAATLVGPSGRLRLFDDGFEWLSPGGEKIDHARPASAERGAAPTDHALGALADALSRLLDSATPDAGPTDHAAVLAMGQAALLSARTGQAESPATIRRMAAVG
jgi:hypothetical protein